MLEPACTSRLSIYIYIRGERDSIQQEINFISKSSRQCLYQLHIYIKRVEIGFQLQERGYCIESSKWLHLNLNTGFHQHQKKSRFHQPKRLLPLLGNERKSKITGTNSAYSSLDEVFDERNSCFHLQEHPQRPQELFSTNRNYVPL